MDRHTRVSYERNPGFLERIGGSLVGILVGLVLITAGCVLLFWNEVSMEEKISHIARKLVLGGFRPGLDTSGVLQPQKMVRGMTFQV